jgi:hypothetical protein
MMRNGKTEKVYVPKKRLFRQDAMLPPRFMAWHFSDETVGLRVTTETIRSWRKSGFFGDRARRAKGQVRLSWQELLTAKGVWSPMGSFEEMQRQPYPSEVVAIKLGLEHRVALDRFRKRKIAGGFKLGAYWYARAADFDASRAFIANQP